MTAETRETTSGFPTHLRDENRSYLTRCGAFAAGVKDRITDQAEQSNCIDCVSHGPASAWVELPDGTRIERRCAALREYDHAIIALRVRGTEQQWVLKYWARGEDEARSLADYASRYSSRRPTVLRVQHAAKPARR